MNDMRKRLYCLLQKLALSAHLFSLRHCCVIKRAFVEALLSLPALAYIVNMNWLCREAEMDLRINGKGSQQAFLLCPRGVAHWRWGVVTESISLEREKKQQEIKDK